jgi:carbamoyltransferase
MNIVGMSAFYHDSACCLIKDGLLVAAAEEERFSRRKHDQAIPKQALRYCLKEGKLTLADVDGIAFYEDPWKKTARQIWLMFSAPAASSYFIGQVDPGRPQREIRRVLGYEGPIEFVEHHQSHAASSYHFSGFPEAAVFTVDGVGEWATTAYGKAEREQIELFEEVHFPDSLGLLYTTITTYLGFAANDGEYKVMGLAPYGEPRYIGQMEKLVQSGPRGSFQLDLKYFDFLQRDRMYTDQLPDLFGQAPRLRNSEVTQFHKDVARSLQCILETILLEKSDYLYSKTQSQNLCMAGGVALNCVANGRILRDGRFKRLFIPPAAGDGGGAIGAAAMLYSRKRNGGSACSRMVDACLGPSFTSEQVALLLQSTRILAEDYRNRESELLSATAKRLAKGEVIGWFQGRMEYGPRALGARSILADPRRSDMRDRINALVKKREEFRPFAPAVLGESAAEHFDLDHLSPFMLETCQVRSLLELPAITHVDGSARVQTVKEENHPRFARMLRAFFQLTGCPMVLNTSFNMRDEPIVCSPLDALICFIRANLDALIIEDFVVDRTSLHAVHFALLQRIQTTHSVVPDQVYTLF